MYFWNYKELALQLRNENIKSKQYHIYIVIFSIFMLLKLYDPTDRINSILGIILLVSITYIFNKLGDGKDYLKHLICLNLPISIRVFVAFVATVFFAGMVEIILRITMDNSVWKDISNSILSASMVPLGIYFMALYIHGFIIASRKKHFYNYPNGTNLKKQNDHHPHARTSFNHTENSR